MVNQWRSLLPPDFWEYGREARRETLLAVRSLIDGAIERLEGDDGPRKSGGSSRRKTRVAVEKAD
jgi:hypothetical protein